MSNHKRFRVKHLRKYSSPRFRKKIRHNIKNMTHKRKRLNGHCQNASISSAQNIVETMKRQDSSW